MTRKRATVWIAVAGMVTAAGWLHAQAPPAGDEACGSGELWMAGRPGRQAVFGLRIPPAARADPGVTFCVDGVVVRADEATMIERDGERTFTLEGRVTLTLPAR